jgi:hypothetical protein
MATIEQVFSIMKLVKTRLRSKMNYNFHADNLVDINLLLLIT